MTAVIELTNVQWARVEHIFDPQGRQGRPARYDRRAIVNALLYEGTPHSARVWLEVAAFSYLLGRL